MSLGPHIVLAAEILAGRRVSICVDTATLAFFDPDTRQLLRTRPNPLSPEQILRLRGARPAVATCVALLLLPVARSLSALPALGLLTAFLRPGLLPGWTTTPATA